MANKNVKKIETFRDKYFSTMVYEYRGCQYEVTYSNSWNCCVTPAWVQHRDEQAKIDDMLDNPKSVEEKEIVPFQQQLDEIWEMIGW